MSRSTESEENKGEWGEFWVGEVNGDDSRATDKDFGGVKSSNSSSSSSSSTSKLLVDNTSDDGSGDGMGDILSSERSSGDDKRPRGRGGELVGVVEELKETRI